jgi:hypothetical protein
MSTEGLKRRCGRLFGQITPNAFTVSHRPRKCTRQRRLKSLTNFATTQALSIGPAETVPGCSMPARSTPAPIAEGDEVDLSQSGGVLDSEVNDGNLTLTLGGGDADQLFLAGVDDFADVTVIV